MTTLHAGATPDLPIGAVEPGHRTPPWRRAAGVSEAVKAEAARTEGHFSAASENLFSAIESLNQLIALCEELSVELDSPDVKGATDALRAVALEVEAAGREEGRRGDVLPRLLALADRINWSVESALAALRPAVIIAMNARVEAARLGDDGMQFTDFADEISAAFEVARTSLQSVGEHMAVLRAGLQTACKREAELVGRLAEAVQDVPPRIAESLEAITSRAASASQVAATISRESRQVSAGVSDAVLALQVGDSARQRLEHVGFALDLAEQVGLRGDLAPLGEGAWRLGAQEGEGLLASCCDLQAEQLVDTARDLVADMAATVGALHALGAAADRIAEAGGGLFTADAGGRSFLAQLAASIGQAQALFGHLDQAWSSADELLESVAHATAELEGQIGAVAAAEKEVRRLALNAIVKSGRVGERGRALAVIAQQLEGCVELTTEQTSAVVAQLEELALLAQELAESGARDARDNVSAASRSMDDAMARLSQMGERVSAGLSRLRSDSAGIAQLIQTCARRLEAQKGAAAGLDAAAEQLRAVAVELGPEAGPCGEVAARFFARIHRVYTMAREREIHLRAVGAPEAASAA